MIRTRNALLWLAVIAAAVLPYLNSLPNDFVWDDRPLILEDHQVRSPRHLSDIFLRDFFSHSEDQVKYGYYRPVITFSYMLDLAVWGLRPAGFRATNILFHAGCAVLVVLLARRLFEGRPFVPWAAGLLFAVHPIHTESVTWIAGRTDVISSFFFLSAFLLHVLQGRDVLRRAGALLFFSLALLAKEMAVVLPAVVFLYEALSRRAGFRTSMLRSAPYAICVVVYLVWRGAIASVSYNPSGIHSSGIYVFAAVKTFWLYVWKLVWPVRLSAYIQNPGPVGIAEASVIATLLLTFGLGLLLARALRRREGYAFPLAAFVVSFVPLMNLVRISAPFDMGFPMSERFLYLPSVFFCAALAFALDRYVSPRALRIGLCAALVVFWSGRTVVRNRDWRDEETFFRACIARAGDAPLLHAALGSHLSAAGRHEEAIAALDEALRLNKAQTAKEGEPILNNLGVAYRMAGRHQEALDLFDRLAARADRPSAVNAYNRGMCLLALGRPADAREAFERGLRLRPDYAEALAGLAEAQSALGDFTASAESYRRAIELFPDSAELRHARGVVLKQAGLLDEAASECRRALERKPDYSDARATLGVVLAMQGDLDGARRELSAALESDPAAHETRNALGAVLATSGDRAAARECFDAVLAARPDDVEALLGKGILLHQDGRAGDARALFERALAVDPRNARARSFLKQADSR